jgi:outer membrane murein-binding lipoprotein Lpp
MVHDFAKQSETSRRIAVPDTTTTGGGVNPQMPEGSYGLGKLEGLVEGLKTNQTITFSAIAVLAAVLLALTSWTLFRVDALSGRIADVNAKVDQLPSRISADLLAIAGAFAGDYRREAAIATHHFDACPSARRAD